VAGYTWDEPRVFTDDEFAFLTVVASSARRRSSGLSSTTVPARGAHVATQLLPANVPLIDGLAVAARYQPVADGSVVGGDFYDVFRRSASSWGIVIGDVSGKGVRAPA
jgi:serine phosphatase RsbU (regulator of sigma subunit)